MKIGINKRPSRIIRGGLLYVDVHKYRREQVPSLQEFYNRCNIIKHRKHIKKDRYTMYRSFDLPNDYSRPATKSPIWAVVTGRKPSS